VLTVLGSLARREAGQRPITTSMLWAFGAAVVAVVVLAIVVALFVVAV